MMIARGLAKKAASAEISGKNSLSPNDPNTSDTTISHAVRSRRTEGGFGALAPTRTASCTVTSRRWRNADRRNAIASGFASSTLDRERSRAGHSLQRLPRSLQSERHQAPVPRAQHENRRRGFTRGVILHLAQLLSARRQDGGVIQEVFCPVPLQVFVFEMAQRRIERVQGARGRGRNPGLLLQTLSA